MSTLLVNANIDQEFLNQTKTDIEVHYVFNKDLKDATINLFKEKFSKLWTPDSIGKKKEGSFKRENVSQDEFAKIGKMLDNLKDKFKEHLATFVYDIQVKTTTTQIPFNQLSKIQLLSNLDKELF